MADTPFNGYELFGTDNAYRLGKRERPRAPGGQSSDLQSNVFILFSQLPTELRWKIWEVYALPRGQVLHKIYQYHICTPAFDESTFDTLRSLIQVNEESRRIVLRGREIVFLRPPPDFFVGRHDNQVDYVWRMRVHGTEYPYFFVNWEIDLFLLINGFQVSKFIWFWPKIQLFGIFYLPLFNYIIKTVNLDDRPTQRTADLLHRIRMFGRVSYLGIWADLRDMYGDMRRGYGPQRWLKSYRPVCCDNSWRSRGQGGQPLKRLFFVDDADNCTDEGDHYFGFANYVEGQEWLRGSGYCPPLECGFHFFRPDRPSHRCDCFTRVDEGVNRPVFIVDGSRYLLNADADWDPQLNVYKSGELTGLAFKRFTCLAKYYDYCENFALGGHAMTALRTLAGYIDPSTELEIGSAVFTPQTWTLGTRDLRLFIRR
ncbi:hypothetical protein F4802DRAFT_596418 [Xylaria palmicola]|nr:hypothetical protein F4802DRAFT_596418 [Xylaria palmicola]